MGRFLAAFGASLLITWVLGFVIGGFALFAGVFVFLVACTLLLKPSPRPSPDEVPLGGALIASLVLGAAAAPLARRFGETERAARERREEALDAAVGNAVDAAGTAVDLGAAYVGNVIDYLTDD